MDIKNINYIKYGTNNKGTIVLLHGWGQNIAMMDMLGQPFQNDYEIIVLDFPGFGESKEPSESYTVEDAAKMLNDLLKHLKVIDPILIGHSFGGRVAICYSATYGASKVILLSSPFRPDHSKKISFKSKVYKLVKKLKLKHLTEWIKKHIASEDYKNASDIMRGTLIKVVNEDLSIYCKNIKCPVVLIYGTKDEAVDYSEAKVLENLIPNAGLVTYEGNTHYAYLERLGQTIAVIDSFLRSNENESNN